jgi:hypothetical protein
MTDTLDRIEVTVEANTVAIAELGSTVNSLLQVVAIHRRNHKAIPRNFEGIVSELREIRTEIRGLRTGNQHILEHLFGRQENGE